MKNPHFGVPVPGLAPCQAALDAAPLLYLDLTEALRRGIGQVLYLDEGACLMGFPRPGKPMTEFATLCGDADAARRVFSRLPWDRDILFAVHETHCLPVLEAGYHVRPFLGGALHQVAYLEAEPLPLSDLPFSVRPLDVRYHQQVAQIHREEDPEYLRDRLEAGVMLGAFDGETLAGFIGVHNEGSMGLLQVCPAYRRQGIGKLLETHMINRLLSLGQVPYGSVLTTNTASLALQRSLGMTPSRPTFHWFFNEKLS